MCRLRRYSNPVLIFIEREICQSLTGVWKVMLSNLVDRRCWVQTHVAHLGRIVHIFRGFLRNLLSLCKYTLRFLTKTTTEENPHFYIYPSCRLSSRNKIKTRNINEMILNPPTLTPTAAFIVTHDHWHIIILTLNIIIMKIRFVQIQTYFTRLEEMKEYVSH